VRFEDDDGAPHYEDFVKKVMDAKLHLRNKDCTDVLEIDPDGKEPYGIETLFAQFAFAGARNNKVDRYVPIEEIRASLTRAIGGLCPVDELIDEYLQKEAEQELQTHSEKTSGDDLQKAMEEDPSSVLAMVADSYESVYEEMSKEYDIFRAEQLPYYKVGHTMSPSLTEALGKSIAFYQSALSDEWYSELMSSTPEERCHYLVQRNRWILLRDKDWERIFDDILACPESFGRYYPMVQVKADKEGLQCIVRAFVTNDALYSYALSLVDSSTKD
jgi:hypothetical protein